MSILSLASFAHDGRNWVILLLAITLIAQSAWTILVLRHRDEADVPPTRTDPWSPSRRATPRGPGAMAASERGGPNLAPRPVPKPVRLRPIPPAAEPVQRRPVRPTTPQPVSRQPVRPTTQPAAQPRPVPARPPAPATVEPAVLEVPGVEIPQRTGEPGLAARPVSATPATPAGATPPPVKPVRPRPPLQPFVEQGEGILLVEDDAAIAALYRTMLEERGHAVRHAPDGMTALEEIAARRPRLVLLDVMMPQMDGITVLQRLREQSEMATLPVAMLSNIADDELVRRALELGALDYVVKAQARPSVLLAAVPHWLRGRRAFSRDPRGMAGTSP